jgi:phenylalanyl-tRNA synthetase beta chain
MDIKITQDWLNDFIEANVSPQKISELLNLYGPSVERREKVGDDTVYSIEVTTNRVDAASVMGIARELTAILPRDGYEIKTKTPPEVDLPFKQKASVMVINDPLLASRLMVVECKNVTIKPSPEFIQKRLTAIGVKPKNNVVDITNYVMYERGIPLHAFDMQKLTEKHLLLRLAQKGETIVTLDNKKHVLKGTEVVFEDGEGVIQDLPGIMGTANTAIDENTTEVLLIAEHIDPVRIRKASLSLEIRTHAAILNEKSVDEEMIPSTLARASYLLKEYANAKIIAVRDVKENKFKSTFVKVKLSQIEALMGVPMTESEISNILHSLGFKTIWRNKKCTVRIPSWRREDVTIAEDVIEEIVRIYGYHALPRIGLSAHLPLVPTDPEIAFEKEVKTALVKTGACEVVTLSLVPQEWVTDGVKIANPLGADGAYLRTAILPSLIAAAEGNRHEKEPFHMFEIGHVFKRKNNTLPDEVTHVAGIFMNTNYRAAKGTLASLLKQIGSTAEVELSAKGNYFVYEVPLQTLKDTQVSERTFMPIPKYPPQVEDMTFVLPKKVPVGSVIASIQKISELIVSVDLVDIYNDAYTVRITYQHPEKTLTDMEITPIRKEITHFVEKELKGEIK